MMPIDTAVDYRTEPALYRHWQLDVQGNQATLALQVDEQGGLRPGYQLKLNSYDLGVDIELADALNRIRFEHPQVAAVVITSNLERTFCSGANIFMLAGSSHHWKVNFCKFTNETRNSIEDASQFSGIRFIAAVNGACAGGGYELALCCDEILLIDDRSSAVSLPEVPLLGVLPGTGGLTRLTDKRHVRHDLADVFCTTTEGVRGKRARQWRLVDDIIKPAVFAETVTQRAQALAASSQRPQQAVPVKLPRVLRTIKDRSKGSKDRSKDNDKDTHISYRFVSIELDRQKGHASITVCGPDERQAADEAAVLAAGSEWWPLAMARQLDDAILHLRTNEPDMGTWLLRTRGDAQLLFQVEQTLHALQAHWLVKEVIGLLRRTFARLDVSSRSLFALIDQHSCFHGLLFELALACDRSYMLALPDQPQSSPTISLSEANFGLYPMITGQSRLGRRFYDDPTTLEPLQQLIGQAMDADQAADLQLVTSNPDDLDWHDEIRLAIEERAAMSPDALSGLEANLRFNGRENMATRIFGRLSAWQNWIFQRPNAVGDKGSLTVYGSGEKAVFDSRRV